MKDAVSWLACGLLLPGIYLMGKKRAGGFALAILANVLWIAWGVLVHAWAVVAESCFIIAMYARALWMWLVPVWRARALLEEGERVMKSARGQ